MTLDELKDEAVEMMALYRTDEKRRVKWAAVLATCLVAEAVVAASDAARAR